MTTPALAAARFWAGLLLGLQLGVLWDLLKPLGRRHPHLCDLLFLPATGWAWLELGFGICGGDLRLGYMAALGVGWIVWELTLGRILTAVTDRIWSAGRRFLRWFFKPLRKIMKNFFNFCKKIFAYMEKWVTIRWNNRRHNAAESGGRTHEEPHDKASSREAGVPQKPSRHQGGGFVRRGTVHGGVADAAKRDPGQPGEDQ